MSKHHSYTSEQIEFLKENARGRSHKELTELFNTHFGLDLKVTQIRASLGNRKIKNGLICRFKAGSVSRNKIINSEHEKYLAKNISGHSHKELLDMFNEHFGLNLRLSTIGCVLSRLKLGNGRRGRGFTVGAESNRDGYINIKIAAPSVWESKHVLIWQSVNGPVPEGYCVIFADGNRNNFDLDNLILVSKSQISVLNRCRLWGNTIEQTKAGIAIADVYLKIADMKKERKAKEA